MTTPTLATARAAYLDNASYDADSSATKCRLFIVACRQLLVLLPSSATGPQGTVAEFSMESVRVELSLAQAWLSANDESNDPRVIYPDFGEFNR